MKRKGLSIIMSLFLSLFMTACDSGDIEETNYNTAKSGLNIKLTGQLSSETNWDEEENNLVIAGFSDQNNYAVMQRVIPSTMLNGEQMELVLTNVSTSVTTLELAVTNTLRKRIITLQSIDLEEYKDRQDTIDIDLGTCAVGYSGVMQHGIFDKACIQCHGGNGRSAGHLNLTNGEALSQLIDVPSTQKEGYTRVVSGDAENSLLRMILHEGGENMLHYNHTEVLSSQFKESLEDVKILIDEWINSL